MTNNPTIDGVSRDLISQAYFELDAGTPSIATLAGLRALLDAPTNDLREHCKQCAEVVKTWPEWKRNCLGGAPAVERKEPDSNSWRLNSEIRCPQCVGHGTYLDGEQCGTCYGSGLKSGAALQSTIAQLQARIAELESGMGEVAPFYVTVGDWNTIVRDDIGIAPVRVSKRKFGPFTEPLYAAPPAPVTVVPDGWKLVPVEPTELMIRRGDQNYSWSVAKIYKAMIEDSPARIDSTDELNTAYVPTIPAVTVVDRVVGPSAEWHDVAGDDVGLAK